MRSVYSLFLALSLSLVSSASGQLSLNPLNWFAGDEEEITNLRVASAADESSASELLEAGRQKMAADSLRSANRIFKRIIKDYPLAKATAEARFLQATIRMTQERWGKAFDGLQMVVTNHPGYENFNRVIAAAASSGCSRVSVNTTEPSTSFPRSSAMPPTAIMHRWL